MQRQFKGWIPNVTGRISFSSIGNTSHPNFCKYSNKTDQSDRYLVAFQKRDTRDFVFPKQFQAILAYILGIDGPLYFSVMAKTYDHDGRAFEKFEGKIFIFKNKKIWKAGPRNKMHQYIGDQNLYSSQISANIKSQFGERYKDLALYLAQHASFHVEFSLLRDGEVTITYNTDFQIATDAPKVQNIANLDYVKLISSQAFFFMKDISHTHQHHNSKTDTVVDLHSLSAGDDVSWREQTLYALYRKIIQFKKMDGEKSKIDALGTLSYTETFAKISEVKLGDDKDKLPKYISEFLRESIEAARLISDLVVKVRAEKREKVENYLIGAVGLGFTIPALLQLTGTPVDATPSGALVLFATWLLQNPFETIGGIFIIVWSHIYVLADSARMRSILRVLVSGNQKVSGVIALLISMAFVWIVYHVLLVWDPSVSLQCNPLNWLNASLVRLHELAVHVYASYF